jgi:hypothetical protein
VAVVPAGIVTSPFLLSATPSIAKANFVIAPASSGAFTVTVISIKLPPFIFVLYGFSVSSSPQSSLSFEDRYKIF